MEVVDQIKGGDDGEGGCEMAVVAVNGDGTGVADQKKYWPNFLMNAE